MAKKQKKEGMYNTVIISSLDIPQYVDLFRECNEVPFFMGSPGLGKTSAIMDALRAQADDMGKIFTENPTPLDWKDPTKFCVAIILTSQIDETDSKGIPHIVTYPDGTTVTVFTPTEMFPQYGCGAVVLDEFPNGRGQVQNAMQQMILDHKAGNYNISQDVKFILAGNKPSDNCGTYNIPQAMRNRVAWFEVIKPSIKNWLDKMEEKNDPIHPKIAGWLTTVGADYLDTLGDAAEQYAYGSPRTVHKASRMLTKMEAIGSNLPMNKVIGGWIGVDAADSLQIFLELTAKIDINAIIKDPKLIHQYEQDAGLMYSLSLTFIDRCVETPTLLNEVLAILLELKPTEFGVFIIKGLQGKWGKSTTERIAKCPNGLITAQKYFKLLKIDMAK